jgi:hypothetical protein
VPYRLHAMTMVKLGTALFFLTGLFLHGVVIWEDPLERAGALPVGLLLLGAIVGMIRRGRSPGAPSSSYAKINGPGHETDSPSSAAASRPGPRSVWSIRMANASLRRRRRRAGARDAALGVGLSTGDRGP